MTTALLSALRAGTRSQHARIEALPLFRCLAVSQIERRRYRACLDRLYGIWCPLEQAIARSGLWQWLELPPMGRRAQLRRDIENLGTPADALPTRPVPALEARYRALGAAYVLEGATLGSRVILRNLRCQDWFQPDRVGHFYGQAAASPDWKRFRSAVNRLQPTHGQIRECVEAARDTFGAVHAWMNHD